MFGDAHGERRLRLGRADDALVGRCVEARREGQLRPVDRDLRARHRCRDRVDDVGQARARTGQVQRPRALERRAAGGDARLRDVLGELQVAGAGVAQRVRLAAHRREHRPGRRGGDALVAADAVDAVRAEADRGDAVVVEVHLRGPLVGALVDAVVGGRAAERLGAVVVAGERRDARGEDDRALDRARLLHGFEDVHGAHDVHRGTERGVRAAERDLQAGEVDDARRARQRRDHRGAVGDVAVAARNAVGVELSQAVAGRAGQVERDDILALVQQPADDPCADATSGARDDVSLAHGRQARSGCLQALLEPVVGVRLVVERCDLLVAGRAVERDRLGEGAVGLEPHRP